MQIHLNTASEASGNPINLAPAAPLPESRRLSLFLTESADRALRDHRRAIRAELAKADGIAEMNATLKRLLGGVYMGRDHAPGIRVMFELTSDDPVFCDWVVTTDEEPAPDVSPAWRRPSSNAASAITSAGLENDGGRPLLPCGTGMLSRVRPFVAP